MGDSLSLIQLNIVSRGKNVKNSKKETKTCFSLKAISFKIADALFSDGFYARTYTSAHFRTFFSCHLTQDQATVAKKLTAMP